MLTDQGGQSTFFVCNYNLVKKREMGGGGQFIFPVPSWIKPVYSGLLFLPTHSSPPTLIPLLYTDTDFYAQLCSIVVVVYMRFISWLLLPQSTADRPTHWTCPPFVSLSFYYCCPIFSFQIQICFYLNKKLNILTG